MICEEEVVDLRIPDPKNFEEGKSLAQLAFELNHTSGMAMWILQKGYWEFF